MYTNTHIVITKYGGNTHNNYSPCFCNGHVIAAGIHNCLLSLPILYSFALTKHLSSAWFFPWWGDPNLHSKATVVLPGLGCYSFP